MNSDGRISSPYQEVMCESLGDGFVQHERQKKGSDGTLPDGSLVECRIVNRNGVSFALSGNQGSGRECSRKDLFEALKTKKWFYVTDTTDPDLYRSVRISVLVVGEWLAAGYIKDSGKMDRDLFWHLLNCRYEVRARPVALKKGWKKGLVNFIQQICDYEGVPVKDVVKLI